MSSWWVRSATLETAEIAIKAAQTGHLVLSTLHTNDAPSTPDPHGGHGASNPYAIATLGESDHCAAPGAAACAPTASSRSTFRRMPCSRRASPKRISPAG